MKSYNIHELFPILFYEFQWTEDEIRPLLEEVQNKKETIKERFNPHSSTDELVEDYWTDYSVPVKILEYEKLVEKISTGFLPELQCNHDSYWTAIYGERGYHSTHKHIGPLYQSIDSNMSSVLYLSNIGRTHFFNPSQIGVNHQELDIQSEVGKMFIWPAHLLHGVSPHGKKNEERIVISSNWRIIQL